MDPDQILRAFVDALSELQVAPQSVLWPGTVQGYDAFANVAYVKVDGSADAVPMVSHIGALTDGQRVTVQFDPPHGAYVTANGTTGGTAGGGGTGGGSGLTTEQVEDLLGYSFIVQGTNMRVVYSDAGGTLTFSVTQLDGNIDANGHTLNNLPDPVSAQQPVTLAYLTAHSSPSDMAFPFLMGS